MNMSIFTWFYCYFYSIFKSSIAHVLSLFDIICFVSYYWSDKIGNLMTCALALGNCDGNITQIF